VEALMPAFGKALNAACIYGPDHARTRQSIEEAYADFHTHIAKAGRFNVNLAEGAVRVEGHVPVRAPPWMRMLRARMVSAQLDGFCLLPRVTMQEFGGLITAIASSRPGELAESLKRGAFQGIQPSQIRLQAVSDTERVVAADQQTGGNAAGGPGAAGGQPGTGSAGEAAPSAHGLLDLEGVSATTAVAEVPEPGRTTPEDAGFSPAQFQQIIAFIKGGESDRPGAGVSGALARAAADPEKLAALITEAAAVQRSQLPAGAKESMADIVIGCLRRTLDQVRPDLAAQEAADEEGTINAQQSLLLLEKLVVDRLRAMMGAPGPAALARIRGLMKEAADRMEADGVALQFMTHRSQLNEQEQKVLALLRAHGPEAFKGTVLEHGLSSADWQQLIVQSGRAAGGGGGGGSGGAGAGSGGGGMPLPQAMATLASVLDQFDALMRTDAPKEKVQEAVEAMKASVEEVASDTERRLDRFDREWGALRGKAADANALRDLMDRLAELGQELLQPLTVINCVLNMLATGGGESIPETSRDMVELANESGIRMRDLMQRLLDIVGLPRSLTPEFERIYGPEGKPAGA
jgi:hypothetical protein